MSENAISEGLNWRIFTERCPRVPLWGENCPEPQILLGTVGPDIWARDEVG